MDELQIPTPSQTTHIDPTFEETMANLQNELDAIIKSVAPLNPMSSNSDEIEEPTLVISG
jgi:hypothetical protein